MNKSLLYVGMDVHAQTIAIALAESGGGAGGEVRNFGSITNDMKSLERALTKIKKAHPGAELRVCYEAGPTGFVIARRLAQLEIPCAVVAPSLIPSPTSAAALGSASLNSLKHIDWTITLKAYVANNVVLAVKNKYLISPPFITHKFFGTRIFPTTFVVTK